MTQIYIKQNIHKHRTQNFRRISPFGITPVEKAQKARTRWYRGIMSVRRWEQPESIRALDCIADTWWTVFAPKLWIPALSFALHLRHNVPDFMARPRAASKSFAPFFFFRIQAQNSDESALMWKFNPRLTYVRANKKTAVRPTKCVSFVGQINYFLVTPSSFMLFFVLHLQLLWIGAVIIIMVIIIIRNAHSEQASTVRLTFPPRLCHSWLATTSQTYSALRAPTENGLLSVRFWSCDVKKKKSTEVTD